MKKGAHLGELEELVLLTVGYLHPGAYGVSIMDEIAARMGRSINVSAIHSVLKRLEQKGFLVSEMGGATSERGGRRKRLFKLTAEGKRTLDISMQHRLALYRNIPDIAFSSE
jgi:DNA-binding PadR family transcriptional regulator